MHPTPDAPQPLSQSQVVAAVAFSSLGWAFDLFDLFILLYVAPVLATVFFPSGRQMLSLAGVYGAFTVTLLVRPLGGTVFGAYADRRGRKRAMVIAATGVGLSTALMGTLPTVASVGAWATALFLGLRVVQGIFMGGMVASTHTLGTESVSPRRRGLASGIISGGGSGVGKLFASLAFLVVSALFPGPRFESWGWRVMFFTGLISSLLGLLVFTRLQESPLWVALQRQKAAAAKGRSSPAQSPVGLRAFVPAVFLGILLTTAGGGLSYLTSGYLPTFMKLVDHVPPTDLGLILSVSAVAVMACSVASGHFSDLIGRKPAMLVCGLVSLVVLPVGYRGLAAAQDLRTIGLFAIVLSGVGTLCYAPLLIILNERFPTALRARGTSLAWNVGFALGGSMPVLVQLFTPLAADLAASLQVSTAVLAALYLVSALLMPTRDNLMT